ncbi:MAG: HPr kinase/phosphatase C-terminal domain-containing protein [Pseudomonadota bacterium]
METLHATAVSFQGRGVLVLGHGGSGKSTLALELMGLGFDLVADDQVRLRRKQDVIWMSCPLPLQGYIEARGVGILAAEAIPAAPLVLCIDLDLVEKDRLPPFRTRKIMGQKIATFHGPARSGFPAAILQYLKRGRKA